MIQSFYCEYLRYWLFIEYLELLHIDTRIYHDRIRSSTPLGHSFFICFRVHEYRIDLAQFFQIEPLQEYWEYEKKWTSQQWYLGEILCSLIEEMTRDRVGVVVGFCTRFYTPDPCDSLIREEDSIIVCKIDFPRSQTPLLLRRIPPWQGGKQKSPLHS